MTKYLCNDKISFFDSLSLRLKRLEFITVYTSIIVLEILLVVSTIIGETSVWYQRLLKHNNSQIIKISWIVASILSYFIFFPIWQDVRVYYFPNDFMVTILFLIDCFLTILWVIVFYYFQNIKLSLWIAIILLIYNFIIFLVVYTINSYASLFLIPTIALYIYLIYNTVQIMLLNNILL